LRSDYNYQLNQIQSDYQHLLEKLELVNPLNIMKKGFAIVRQDDLIKKHFNEIDKAKDINIEITGGEIIASIKDMRGKE